MRIGVTCLFLLGCLLALVLNPGLLYAYRTPVGGYVVYHTQPLEPALAIRLQEATALLQASPLYPAGLHLNVCLNDGSIYPDLIRTLLGPAFAWGFGRNVVLGGQAQYRANCVSLYGSADVWNLTQLLAHEAVHCVQFAYFGFWHSNPAAGYPAWKWEGYPEYVARRAPGQLDLRANLRRLATTEADDWWIPFADGSGVIKPYYRYWTMMQFCMDVKKMPYENVLTDTTTNVVLEREMEAWARGLK